MFCNVTVGSKSVVAVLFFPSCEILSPHSRASLNGTQISNGQDPATTTALQDALKTRQAAS